MTWLSVVGARPQFVKVAALDWELSRRGIDHRILHTGQHYDEALSASFFRDLEIAEPSWNLEVGSGSHGTQTAAMLAGCEQIFAEAEPEWVICYGDTNSTVAAALAAVKMHLPIAHVEAGLRSFNRSMPEEHNRVVADHLADVLLAPTRAAVENLAVEGLAHRATYVGDVMGDVIAWVRDKVSTHPAAEDYVVATIHRAENTDDPARLRSIIYALAELPIPVRLFAHPRLRAKATEFDIALTIGALQLQPPAEYLPFIRAIAGSCGVVTDSGGLQKEAYMLGVPCTTVRTETEWTNTLHDGWNMLAEPKAVADAVMRPTPTAPCDPAAFGDGHAAAKVTDTLAASNQQILARSTDPE